MHDEVGVVFVASSDDAPFLERALQQCLLFTPNIAVSFGTRFWNGDVERPRVISGFRKRFPAVAFFIYGTDERLPGTQAMVKNEMYNEALARWTAVSRLPKTCTHVLFLDSDEVVDGRLFSAWLDTHAHLNLNAMKFANFWYWRSTEFRAADYLEDSVVMLKRGLVRKDTVFSNGARTTMYDNAPLPKQRAIKDAANNVMIHHYSWTRTRQQMLRKVTSWGHRSDFACDLVAQVREEFSRPFNGTDFIRGLRYMRVNNEFDIEFVAE